MSKELVRAFHQTCKQAIKPNAHYLCLMISVPYYGGPEEGGWWGSDEVLVAYQEYPSEELASEAREKVEELVSILNKDACDAFGDHCLQTMEWLDARGLDANFLPEVDGEEHYYLTITDEIPQNQYGERQYS